MNPAPPVTSTFIAITVLLVLHPPTYTVLLRRVSTTGEDAQRRTYLSVIFLTAHGFKPVC
jgi:hypothetical protein